jgi:DNA-directed RNA polymerase subunit RPC12/RpoP
VGRNPLWIPHQVRQHLVAYACVSCQRSFKRPAEAGDERKCPHCGERAVCVGRHFKPPRRANKKQWDKVRFLIQEGFPFQHVRSVVPVSGRARVLARRARAREFDTLIRRGYTHLEALRELARPHGYCYAPYPRDLSQARGFVRKHRSQAMRRVGGRRTSG